MVGKHVVILFSHLIQLWNRGKNTKIQSSSTFWMTEDGWWHIQNLYYKKTNKQTKNSSYSEWWFLTINIVYKRIYFWIPFHANNKQWALNQPVLPQHYISCVCAAASVQSCFATFLILLKMLSSLPDWTSPIMVLLLYSLAVGHGLWVANLGGV